MGRNVIAQPLITFVHAARIVHIAFIWTQGRLGLTEDPVDVRIASTCSFLATFVAKVTIATLWNRHPIKSPGWIAAR